MLVTVTSTAPVAYTPPPLPVATLPLTLPDPVTPTPSQVANPVTHGVLWHCVNRPAPSCALVGGRKNGVRFAESCIADNATAKQTTRRQYRVPSPPNTLDAPVAVNKRPVQVDRHANCCNAAAPARRRVARHRPAYHFDHVVQAPGRRVNPAASVCVHEVAPVAKP